MRLCCPALPTARDFKRLCMLVGVGSFTPASCAAECRVRDGLLHSIYTCTPTSTFLPITSASRCVGAVKVLNAGTRPETGLQRPGFARNQETPNRPVPKRFMRVSLRLMQFSLAWTNFRLTLEVLQRSYSFAGVTLCRSFSVNFN